MRKRLLCFVLALFTSACSGGLVSIHSEPPRAHVTINGTSEGITPLELDLDCDEQDAYDIVVSAPGYKTRQETITCRWIRGPKKNVFIELEPGDQPVQENVASVSEAQEAYGTLEVKSLPDKAEVFLDDKFIGTTPLVNDHMGVGSYTVEVRKEGFVPGKKSAQVTPGAKSSHFLILERK